MADVNLTVTIPDAMVSRVLAAFNNMAEKDLYLMDWKWRYVEKQSGENNINFGKRVIRELIRALVRESEYTLDINRYKNEQKAIAIPSQNVPDEIIT